MAKLLWKKKLIQFAVEVTFDVDAIDGGATPIPIYAKNVTFAAGQGETERAEYEKPYLGNDPVRHLEHLATLSFEVEIPATGTAGTAAPFNELLQFCWMDMVEDPVGPPASVTHSLIDLSPTSGTFYFRIDNERHALTGVLGKVVISFNRRKVPIAKFELQGTHLAPVKEALPSADFDAWKRGVVLSRANTPTFTLHGFAACMESLEITIGSETARRDLVNCNAPALTARPVSGKVKIDAPELDVKNYWQLARDEIGDALDIIHGTSAGGQFQLQCPNVQVLQPSPGDSDGIYSQDIDLNIMPSTGNDDITLISL